MSSEVLYRCSIPQSRGVDLRPESAYGQSEDNHKLLQMRHQADTPVLCPGANQPRLHTQRVKIAVYLTAPKIYLQSRYKIHPEARGWGVGKIISGLNPFRTLLKGMTDTMDITDVADIDQNNDNFGVISRMREVQPVAPVV